MKIELRNIKYAAFASQETSCFQATIYIDGKKAGTVENDGHGGSDNIHPHGVKILIDSYGLTLPMREASWKDEAGKPIMLTQDAETIIGDLLTNHLIERDVKRLTANRLIYTKPGVKGIFQTVKLTPENKANLMARITIGKPPIKDMDTCLNVLPLAQAVAIFRANAS